MDWIIIRTGKKGEISLLSKKGTSTLTHLNKEKLIELSHTNRIKRYKTEKGASRKVNWLSNIFSTDRYSYIREDQLELI